MKQQKEKIKTNQTLTSEDRVKIILTKIIVLGLIAIIGIIGGFFGKNGYVSIGVGLLILIILSAFVYLIDY